MMVLRHPWFLALLALVPLVWWAWRDPRRRAAIRFAGVARLEEAGRQRAVRARAVLPILRSLAVVLLVLAVARPQRADEQTRVQTEGIAVQLVMDRSGSMLNEDFRDADGRMGTRLAAVKDVVKSFVLGDGDKLAGRPDDLIGLIAFARYADTDCPMTRDHSHLLRALDEVQVPRTREEDGTAIGDALLLAVERTRSIERHFHEGDAITIKSRVIILLTDGEQNCGKYLPEKSAQAAAALGIKVYTIGVAPEYQEQTVGGFFVRPQKIRVPVNVDEATLSKVAAMTGGKYFRAKDADSLSAIYADIDRLERTKIEEERYYTYQELAYQWGRIGSTSWPPVLLVALGLLAAEILLGQTWFRRIP